MQTALRVTTRVLPGHRVEIIAPELTDGDAVDVFVVTSRPTEPAPDASKRGSVWELIHRTLHQEWNLYGDAAEVFVVMPNTPEATPSAASTPSLMEFLDSLPPGPRSAPTWEEIERNLQEDRDSWDR